MYWNKIFAQLSLISSIICVQEILKDKQTLNNLISLYVILIARLISEIRYAGLLFQIFERRGNDFSTWWCGHKFGAFSQKGVELQEEQKHGKSPFCNPFFVCFSEQEHVSHNPCFFAFLHKPTVHP